jgi:hypothetical protein
MSETTPSQRTPSECANDASTRVTGASKRTVKPHPFFDPGPPVVVYNGSKKRKNLMTMKELAEFSKLDRSELYHDRASGLRN